MPSSKHIETAATLVVRDFGVFNGGRDEVELRKLEEDAVPALRPLIGKLYLSFC